MAIIETPTEHDASEEIRPIFEAVEQVISFVPRPTQMLATSPVILKSWWDVMKYYGDAPEFSRELTAYIRLLVAVHGEFPFCIQFNTIALSKLLGLSEEQVAEAIRDPQLARLPENERALLLFVLEVVKHPEDVSETDVQALRKHGWSDRQIFEGAYYGAWMMLVGLLFNAFKMHEE